MEEDHWLVQGELVEVPVELRKVTMEEVKILEQKKMEIVHNYLAIQVKFNCIGIFLFCCLTIGLSTSCSNGVCSVSCAGETKCSGMQCSSLSTSCSNGNCQITCNGGSSGGGGNNNNNNFNGK